MGSLWMVLVFGACFVQVHGTCFIATMPVQTPGHLNEFCIRNEPYERFDIGETKITKDCYSCTCSETELDCCGVGPNNTGPRSLEPGCSLVIDPANKCNYTISCANS